MKSGTTESSFPHFNFSGRPDDIGYQHGQQLCERIENTIEWYGRLFGRAEAEVFTAAKHFKKLIRGFNQDYATEIEAIAVGAGVNPAWIYALNARSELLAVFAPECTAVYFPTTGILGQNWDWTPEFEELVALFTIERNDGHRILMMSEPGIIGKMGMSNSGLGICLNILNSGRKTNGLPVHVLLRSILDSQSLKEARESVQSAASGKASNIMIGSETGEYLDVEFAGHEYFSWAPTEGVPIHTNHYLAADLNQGKPLFASSLSRYRRASELAEGLSDYSVEDMKALLSDRAKKYLSIYAGYHRHETLGHVGTVVTLIMDLPGRALWVRVGNGREASFNRYGLAP